MSFCIYLATQLVCEETNSFLIIDAAGCNAKQKVTATFAKVRRSRQNGEKRQAKRKDTHFFRSRHL